MIHNPDAMVANSIPNGSISNAIMRFGITSNNLKLAFWPFDTWCRRKHIKANKITPESRVIVSLRLGVFVVKTMPIAAINGVIRARAITISVLMDCYPRE